VLKTVLFAWCRSEGRGVHLCVDEAIDSGYVLEGGAFPQEWVAACDEWPPRDKGAAPPYAPPSDDLNNFPALGADAPPAASPPVGPAASPPDGPPPQQLLPPRPSAFPSEAGGGASAGAGGFGGRASGFGAPQQALAAAGLAPQRSVSRDSSAASIAAMWGTTGDLAGGAGLWSTQPTLAESTPWAQHTATPAAAATEQQQQQALLLQLLGQQQAARERPAPPAPQGAAGAEAAGEAIKPPSGWAAIAAKPAQSRPATSATSEGGSSSDVFQLESLPGCRVLSSHAETVVQLHQTNIVTLHANTATLNSGGWRTFSTLKAMNAVLESCVPPTRIVAEGHLSNGAWRVVQGDESFEFKDGMSLSASPPPSLTTKGPKGSAAARGGVPPADYVCKLCNVAGHWLDRCPHKAEPKPPPPSYTCRLCQRPGHWIQLCPSIQPDGSVKHEDPRAASKAPAARVTAPAATTRAQQQQLASRAAAAAAREAAEERAAGQVAATAVATAAATESMVESLREMSGVSRERCRSALKVPCSY